MQDLLSATKLRSMSKRNSGETGKATYRDELVDIAQH